MRVESSKRLLLISAIAALAGCASMADVQSKYDVKRQSVQSFEIVATRMSNDQAFSALTAILVERGFDIKVSNKDSGLVSTEYKKFASLGGSPPFDYYLQLRATLRPMGAGKTAIKLTPLVKEQNRTNAAAFTERELHYFEGPPEAVKMADRGGWVNTGQTTFMNVVADVSARAGVSIGDVTKNVTTTTYNALLRK